MNDHGPDAPHTGVLTDYITALTAAVNARVGDYGVFLPAGETLPGLVSWTEAALLEHGGEPERFAAHLLDDHTGLDAAATSIATRLLLDLAEERPGTNRWAAERHIPTPAPVATMLLHGMTASSGLAYTNRDPHFAQHLAGEVSALADLISVEYLTRPMRPVRSVVLLGGARRLIDAPLVWLPQPALAHIARLLDCAATRVSDRRWRVSEGHDPVALASVLGGHALLVRDLTARFGRSTRAAA